MHSPRFQKPIMSDKAKGSSNFNSMALIEPEITSPFENVILPAQNFSGERLDGRICVPPRNRWHTPGDALPSRF
jgi:hypothetical protein